MKHKFGIERMERVNDNDCINLQENKIIAESCQLEWKNSEILFEGKGNVVYFSGKKNEVIHLQNTRIKCIGDNNLIFVCSSRFPLKAVITVGYGCTIYIWKEVLFYNSSISDGQ